MVRNWKAAIANGLGLSLLVVSSVAFTQDTFAQQLERVRDVAQNRDGAQSEESDDTTAGLTIRASRLMGMNVRNAEGVGVGMVHDIVLDASSGRIRYLTLLYRESARAANKLFAVPFAAFTVRRSAETPNEYVLVLNVTRQRIEETQGFDEDNWPDFTDPNFSRELDRRYGIRRRVEIEEVERLKSAKDRATDVNAEIDRIAEDADLEVKPRQDRS